MENLRKQEQSWQHKGSATQPNPKNFDFFMRNRFYTASLVNGQWSMVNSCHWEMGNGKV